MFEGGFEQTFEGDPGDNDSKRAGRIVKRSLGRFTGREPNHDAAQLIDARYLIGEAYRRSARAPREKLESDTIETSRIAHNKQMQAFLTAATAQYEQVQDLLTRRQEQSELEPSEQAILRNCYFARGAALYDMGRYEDAIRAYSAATNRYQHEPEVLEALLRLRRFPVAG